MMTAKRWSILAMIALLCVTLCTGAAAEETTPLEAAIAKYEAEQYEEARRGQRESDGMGWVLHGIWQRHGG